MGSVGVGSVLVSGVVPVSGVGLGVSGVGFVSGVVPVSGVVVPGVVLGVSVCGFSGVVGVVVLGVSTEPEVAELDGPTCTICVRGTYLVLFSNVLLIKFPLPS